MIKYKYWVYDLSKECLFGPFTFKDAAKKREEIGRNGIVLQTVVDSNGELVK